MFRFDLWHFNLSHGGEPKTIVCAGSVGSVLQRHGAGTMAERGWPERDRAAARPCHPVSPGHTQHHCQHLGVCF